VRITSDLCRSLVGAVLPSPAIWRHWRRRPCGRAPTRGGEYSGRERQSNQPENWCAVQVRRRQAATDASADATRPEGYPCSSAKSISRR